MQRKDAEALVMQHIKAIYGFALKRAKNLQDAEDLSQEITLRIFRALLARERPNEPEKFIWTVVHNTLANYYRDAEKYSLGTPLEDISELLPSDSPNAEDAMILRETTEKLHDEIAHLSKLQRQIIILYYYENKKQEDIATMLSIPIGTVKWHLFEAKKELKRGMNRMREHSNLKFNPIRFEAISTNGNGFNAPLLRSVLAQNIIYVTKDTPKTINEIADALGVSPVYVESEAEYLETYAFLSQKGDRYLSEVLIEEPTNEQMRLHDEMYEKASALFGNALYDEILSSGILDDENIYGARFGKISMTEVPPRDKNFMLWALIPYITAMSGKPFFKEDIRFEEVASYRPDGSRNICTVSVMPHDITPPKYLESLKNSDGPSWSQNPKIAIWSCDSEWSEKRIVKFVQQHNDRNHVLNMLMRLNEGYELTAEELAELSEKGYISVLEENGNIKITPLVIEIADEETRQKVLDIGNRVRAKLYDELEALKEPYIRAVMQNTPKHLQKVQAFQMQYTFYSDGWFLVHIFHTLIENDKLKAPTEEQKRSLSTVISFR